MIVRKEFSLFSLHNIVVFLSLAVAVGVISYFVNLHFHKKQMLHQATLIGEVVQPTLESLFLQNAVKGEYAYHLNWVLSTESIQTACIYNARNQLLFAVPNTNTSLCPSQMIGYNAQEAFKDNAWLDIVNRSSGQQLGGLMLMMNDSGIILNSVKEALLISGFVLFITFISYGLFARNRKVTNGPSLEAQFKGTPSGLSEKELTHELIDAFKEMSAHLEKRNEGLTKESEALIEANRKIHSVLLHATHELRNPLHAIINFSDIGFKKVSDTSPQESKELGSYLGSIRQSAGKILQLISLLMDHSKMETGLVTLNVEKENILPVIKEVLAEKEAIIAKKHITTAIDTSELPKGYSVPACYCDRLQVGMVISNLLNNAIAFTPEKGRIDVALSVVKEEINVGFQRRIVSFLKIKIKDTGVGFPPNELENIFNPFEKGSNSVFSKEKDLGIGLGLSLSREIVHAHRGHLVAENRRAGGAVISLTLPMEEVESDGEEFFLQTPSTVKATSSEMRKLGSFSED